MLRHTAHQRHPRVRRDVGAAPVLAGQEPAGERVIGQYAQSKFLAGRQNLAFDSSIQQVVLVLRRHVTRAAASARDPVRISDLPSAEIAVVEISDFARAHEIVERRKRFLRRCLKVRLVSW